MLAFLTPQCQERAMNKRYEVAIVGAGPVGMALAIDLGLRGISCILIERRTEPQRISTSGALRMSCAPRACCRPTIR
jgi:2-polyprenyl-6-methoxyphenol hydroxylase-like FAD-dependent oxidoreductase